MIPFIQRVTSRSSPFSARLGGAQLGREQRAHDLHRQRGDVEVGGDRARPATVAPAIAPERTVIASTASPSRTSTPRERRCAIQGSIQTSEVGASSTRSARSPARERSSSSWTRISPPVRALISFARAATSVRVSPSAR